MKNKVIVLIIMILMLCGCETNSIRVNTNGINELIVDYDRDTCVEYVEYNGIEKGGLSVRYNADGTIKLNEECINGKE